MNAECRMTNDGGVPRFPRSVPTHPSSFILYPFQRSAFTLIEMLTVIAIIGVLAAILLPTIRIAMQRAKIAAAKGDLGNIEMALNMYNMEFGAYPPDSVPWDTVNDEPDSWPLPRYLSPNECLVWFLTRDYSTASTAAGVPGTSWNPATSPTVFSRVALRGGLDLKAKQQRNDNDPPDGFYEFVDPWGRPYFYRAYLSDWADLDSVSVGGSGTAADPYYAEFTLSSAVPGLAGGRGSVQVRNCTTNANFNGTFEIEGQSDNVFNVIFGSTDPGTASDGEFRFLLHNPQTCDLYSLGSNGRTRSGLAPGAQPWNAQNSPGDWNLMWGTPGDGNDVAPDRAGNLSLEEEKDQDDVNNWSG